MTRRSNVILVVFTLLKLTWHQVELTRRLTPLSIAFILFSGSDAILLFFPGCSVTGCGSGGAWLRGPDDVEHEVVLHC